MPKFYFHLRNDIDVPDDEGRDLPDLEAARDEAICLARFEISQAVTRDAKITLSHRIEIEDDDKQVVDTVWFRDVVAVEG